AREPGVVVDTNELGVEPFDGRGFGKIESFALRCTFDDVEERDVAEFFQPRQERERAADLAGSDQCDFAACHTVLFPSSAAERLRSAPSARSWILVRALFLQTAPSCKRGGRGLPCFDNHTAGLTARGAAA